MSKKSSEPVVAKLYKRSEDESLSKAARLYHLRRESRLCVKCGGQLDESSKLLCTSHLDYYNNWHLSKRAAIKAKLARLEELEQQLSEQDEVVQTTKKSNRQRKNK